MKIESNAFVLAWGLIIASAGCAAETDANVSATTAALAQGLTGTYDFVVDASDVASKLRAKCEAESGGDAARATRCFDEIRTESKLEKIRFSRNAAGDLVYTSFAVEGDREVVFVEVPITITRAEPGGFVAKAAGFPRGTFVGRISHIRAELRVEHTGDTIVLADPNKGRLVYRRAS